MKLKVLAGSADKIVLPVVPFLAIGLILNISLPTLFAVGGPTPILKAMSLIILIPGVAIWVWSALLILLNVPRKRLITTGPFALVKHPLYTGVALFVLPWVGFLLDTWLGALIGIVLYLASRRFSPDEEAILSKEFGAAWDEYSHNVKLPWL